MIKQDDWTVDGRSITLAVDSYRGRAILYFDQVHLNDDLEYFATPRPRRAVFFSHLLAMH